jgi:hypothetical protein
MLKRYLLGNRQTVAGTVYGTIIVLSVLTAGAKPYKNDLWRLVVLAAVSVLVLWVAHVYSHGLGESLRIGRRLTPGELASVARREYSIVLAAVLPIVSIALGAMGVVSPETAVELAFIIGMITLTAQGVRYSQLEQLGFTATFTTVALNVLVGLTLIAAEVLIAH